MFPIWLLKLIPMGERWKWYSMDNRYRVIRDVLTPGKCKNVTAFSDRTHDATLTHANHQISWSLAARNSWRTTKRSQKQITSAAQRNSSSQVWFPKCLSALKRLFIGSRIKNIRPSPNEAICWKRKCFKLLGYLKPFILQTNDRTHETKNLSR